MKPSTVASALPNVNSAFRASRPQNVRLSHQRRIGRPGIPPLPPPAASTKIVPPDTGP
jgi:hypothetical protein